MNPNKAGMRFIDEEAKRSIGQYIESLRGNRSQADIAKTVGVSRSAWANYESGRRLPSADIVARIETVTKVATGSLYAAINGSGEAVSSHVKMPDVGRVIDRMKLVLDIKTDVALADYLCVANQTVGAWRTRGSLPIEACIQIAQQKGVSLDYLILGNTGSSPTGGKIDVDLFKECWKAACDHSDSIVSLRDLTVRTYNFCRGDSDTANRVTVDDIAAILSSTDGST